MSILRPVALLFGCLLASNVVAGDWPQFLGPDRNGVSTETHLNLNQPAAGPPALWRRPVGEGFSSPVVQGGRLILFHRIDNNDQLLCLNATNGEPIWSYDSPSTYKDSFGFEEGPRATPVIANNRIYALGANGKLHCVRLADGSLVWQVDTLKQYNADTGFFGMAGSPLMTDDFVVIHLGGGTGKGVAAFDRRSGTLRWSATDHEAGYSSPVLVRDENADRLFCFTREGLVSLKPNTGEVQFEFPWRSRMHASVNAALPVVVDHHVFLTASYQTGAAWIRFKDGLAVSEWESDDVLSAHFATPVYRDGLLFGFHGRVDLPPGAVLRCVEATTGRVLWTDATLRSGNVMWVQDHLLVLGEDGRLMAAPAVGDGLTPLFVAQVLGRPIRAHPALADGLFYARDTRQLVCLDLRKSATEPADD